MTKLYIAALTGLALLALGFSLVQTAQAAIPETYTQDNFFTSRHDAPVSYWRDSLGNSYGYTARGKYFSQTNVANTYEVRLQKFVIDEAFYYISDQGIIRANSDLTALSIYLTRLG
ncbi:MAG TPA: hypothetical protein VKP88_08260 [Candidatus Paceibacterota bacterium]|nr:hypothetical protein [Candidatus Paceibacterota bacterium]